MVAQDKAQRSRRNAQRTPKFIAQYEKRPTEDFNPSVERRPQAFRCAFRVER
jgi:hypothetical protein